MTDAPTPPAVAALVERLNETAQALHYDHTRRNPLGWKNIEPVMSIVASAAAALEALARERDEARESVRDWARGMGAVTDELHSFDRGAEGSPHVRVRAMHAALLDARDERDALRARVAELEMFERMNDRLEQDNAAADARIAALESEARQLALDLQSAEARASGAEARLAALAEVRRLKDAEAQP